MLLDINIDVNRLTNNDNTQANIRFAHPLRVSFIKDGFFILPITKYNHLQICNIDNIIYLFLDIFKRKIKSRHGNSIYFWGETEEGSKRISKKAWVLEYYLETAVSSYERTLL